MRIQTPSGDPLHRQYRLDGHDFVRSVVAKSAPSHRLRSRPRLEALRFSSRQRAYAVAVEDRAIQLVDAVEALNVVDKLLDVDTSPLTIGAHGIDHPEWIRLTLEVLLSRLRSIRDCLLLLVTEVFELKLARGDINLKNLVPLLVSPRVIDLLVRSADVIRNPGANLDSGFEAPDLSTAALPVIANEGAGETGAHEDCLDRIQRDLVTSVRASYRRRGDRLVSISTELLDLIQLEFEQRWSTKDDAVARPVPIRRPVRLAASFGHQ